MDKDKPIVVPQVKDEKIAPDTSSETRKMMGFSSVDEVAKSAPKHPTSDDAARRGQRGKSLPTKRSIEEQQKQEKDKAVEEALSKVGIEMMKELASLPYDAWAVFVSDPALSLNKDEQEKLANTYYMIFKSLKPEQIADWRVLLLLVGLQNGRIVLAKARQHHARIEQVKKALGQSAGTPVEVSVI